MESEDRYRSITQSVPAFVFIATPELEWKYVNPPFYQYTGLSEGNGLGAGWFSVIHPDDVSDVRKRWRQAVAQGSAFESELRLKSIDDDYQWFMGRAEPVTTGSGEGLRWFGSCTNIQVVKVAEHRQRLLYAELQHQVRNILAVVRSIANRTADNVDNLEDFSAHFEGRLSAMGRTQNMMARTPGSGVDLGELVHEELVGCAAHDNDQVEVKGSEVKLGAKPAEMLGLAIHELTTNAVKYGALSTPTGHIKIEWRNNGTALSPSLTLTWEESGVPVIDRNPPRSGFGRELIERGLPYELQATTVLEFRQGGVRCVITVPLTGRITIGEKV